MGKVVVGLDIGTTKIACFVGRKNEHGKIEILSMGKTESLGVMRGMVSNIEKTIQSINGAVAEAEERSEGKLKIKTVNVGIAGQHIKSIQHRGIHTRTNIESEISQEDINRLVDDMYKMAMPPGEEIITVLPQEYIIDNEVGIKDPIGMSGVRLEANFHIITGNIGASMNIHKCVERSGLKVKDIILEPIASADAVLTDEEKEAGVVLVDIGGGTTDVAIFHEGIIRHTAVIPFGGNVITDDIKEGCTIMKRQAEKLKQKFGSALASESQENEVVAIPGLRGRAPKEITIRNLASIIQARMEEIIDLVHFEIRNSGYEKKLIGGIVVTGGGSQLKHITQLFEYVTGMDSRIGYPTEHLANTNNEAIKSPMYATGIGLVHKGFEDLEKSVEAEAASAGDVITSTTKKRGSFFDSLMQKGKTWFEVED
ncbi:cell division protein FtsA [Crocinitomicaceae bacterium]|nr:cell division protein FtsA [Crocinitomicaceae bacterium]MDC1385192.1 cell division protein FtsA [Crocinitomicaceae bacterium]|tara:strand:- start:5843 stop:7120 length:1278 start_codon:yes stop_codon:yes gene_type:complete